MTSLARHACRADSSCQAPGIWACLPAGGRSASASTSRAIAIASWVSLLARVRRRRLSAVRFAGTSRTSYPNAPRAVATCIPNPAEPSTPIRDNGTPTSTSHPANAAIPAAVIANEADATSPPTPLSTATVADRLCGSIPATAPPT